MKKRYLILIFLLLLSFNAFAKNADDIISIKFLNSSEKLDRGKKNPLSLEITIKELFHINSQQPTEDYLVPVSLKFDAVNGIKFGEPEFPEAEIKKLGISNIPLSIYEGTFVVKNTIMVSPSYKDSELTISGILGYQACDDNSCLAPTELYFQQLLSVTGQVEGSDTADTELVEFSSQKSKDKTTITTQEGEFSKKVKENGLFVIFLLIFLGGLALNLTPCVYPIIPITIGYFGGQAEGRKGKIISHALLYVLGMALTYSSLGLIAALSGSLFGAALQNPLVLIFIAAVLLTLALSMFDLYEFRLPSFLTKIAGGSKKGYFGSLLMGLTVGLVAAPCIGPFVLGLLTFVGERGNPLLGFLMFFVLALGLGMPLMFLAIFSGSINKLPKSGAWMIWVRKIFGFILIAMAIYFLKTLFPTTLFYHLALALNLFIAGIYLAWIEPTKLNSKSFLFIRNFIGIVFFVLALFFTVAGIESYLETSLEKTRLNFGDISQSNVIQWDMFSPEKIKEAKSTNKPVFLDFYADWCIPCKELDKLTFTNPQIIKSSREFIMLKVDLTTSSNPLSKKLRNKYQIKGVPTLVLLKPDGTEVKEARVVGFIKAKGLLSKMQKVLQIL